MSERPQDRWPTVYAPEVEGKFYAALCYREWCLGPFDSLEEVRAFYDAETERDPYFSYDGFGVFRGKWGAESYLDCEPVPRSEWKPRE